MPVTRSVRRLASGVCACVVFFMSPGIMNADTCTSSSGTSCSMSCSVGTLSLVCSKTSNSCSGSCSDRKGNVAKFLGSLARDIYVASEFKIKKEDIFSFFRHDLNDVSRGHEHIVKIGQYSFDLRIGPGQEGGFSGPDFDRAVKRVENAFQIATDQQIRNGEFLSDLDARQ